MAGRTPEPTAETGAAAWRPVYGPPLSAAVVLVTGLALVLLATGWHQARAGAAGLAPILAAAVVAPARLVFALDETGQAVAGKAVAALLCALAAGLLFLAVGRRQPESAARWSALLFALGTGVWSASLTLGPGPFILLLLCAAVLCMVRAEEDPAWAGRAGLPLALAAAIQPPDMALAGLFAAGLALRWWRRIPFLLAWGLPGLAVLSYKLLYTGMRPPSVDPLRHLSLLASPAHGLLVLAPLTVIAAVGLVSAFRHGERWPAATLGAAILAHWAFVGCLEPSPPGEGPGSMLAALPLLFLFLPDGLEACGSLGSAVAVVSVVIQAALVLGDGGRWARLNAGGARAGAEWDLARSPIASAIRERTAILALPGVAGGKAFVREQPFVLFGPQGSRVAFGGGAADVTGAEALFGDVRVTGGARVEVGRLRLGAPGDGLSLRIRPPARARPRLELRIVGRGRGTVSVSEKTFWSAAPRTSAYPVAGDFRLRHPYQYPESGGPDLAVGLGPGSAIELESVTLAAPGDPDNPIRLPAGP